MYYKAEKNREIFTYVIIGLNALVFIATELGLINVATFWSIPIRDISEVEPYRLVTAMFLHGDIMHIAMNLLVLGTLHTEKYFGTSKFLTVYFIAGIGSALVSAYIHGSNGDMTASLGASGAIYGLIGALLIFAIKTEGRYIEPFRLVFYLFYSLLNYLYAGGNDGIDHVAHISGCVIGVLLGFIMFGNSGGRRRHIDGWDNRSYYN